MKRSRGNPNSPLKEVIQDLKLIHKVLEESVVDPENPRFNLNKLFSKKRDDIGNSISYLEHLDKNVALLKIYEDYQLYIPAPINKMNDVSITGNSPQELVIELAATPRFIDTYNWKPSTPSQAKNSTGIQPMIYKRSYVKIENPKTGHEEDIMLEMIPFRVHESDISTYINTNPYFIKAAKKKQNIEEDSVIVKEHDRRILGKVEEQNEIMMYKYLKKKYGGME